MKRRGFRCKKEVLEQLRHRYDEITTTDFKGDYLRILENFDIVAEGSLRNILYPHYDSRRSADAAWRTCKGSLYEYAVFKVVNKIIFEQQDLKQKFIALVGDDALIEYKEQLVIRNWNEIFPDVDILIIEKETNDVKAIISCKTSLRERFTETAFWKRELEKRSNTKNIKLIFVTTDKDDELRVDTNRYILLHVIDCTFVTNPHKFQQLMDTFKYRYGKREDFYELLSKVRNISEIGDYLRSL